MRIVVIEDDKEMAQFLRDLLQEHQYIVYLTHSGSEGLSLIEKIQPRLVLLDLNLPDLDGRSLCAKIKSLQRDIKVIMVTAEGTARDIARGLDLGADDYLAKPINSTELLARIKARLRSRIKNDHLLKLEDLELNQLTHEVRRSRKQIYLSAQEFRLLEHLLLNQNLVQTREMILSRIWPSNPDIETRVVDVYIGYLRKKIDFTRPKLLHTVRGFGYVLKK